MALQRSNSQPINFSHYPHITVNDRFYQPANG